MTAPNDCDFAPLLGPFHDGELPPARAEAVAAHLRTCQACAAELAEVRDFSRAFRTAGRPTATPPPARWEDAVLAAAREQGLLAEATVDPPASRPQMRISGAADDDADGAELGAGATATSAAVRRVTEPPRAADPRHLWYVRRLSAAAAVVFLVAAGQVAYQHFNRHGSTGVSPIVEPTGLPSRSTQNETPEKPGITTGAAPQTRSGSPK